MLRGSFIFAIRDARKSIISWVVASSLPTFRRVMEPLLRTPAEGADTIVWLAAAPRDRLESGRFYFDRTPRNTHYLPTTRTPTSAREQLKEGAGLFSSETQPATPPEN